MHKSRKKVSATIKVVPTTRGFKIRILNVVTNSLSIHFLCTSIKDVTLNLQSRVPNKMRVRPKMGKMRTLYQSSYYRYTIDFSPF